MTNEILSALSSETRERLADALEPVELADGQVLCESGAEIRRVYFPGNAVISIVQIMREGSAAEIGMIGREGACGLDAILREGVATARNICQVPGTAWSLTSGRLREAIAECDDLRRSLLRYVGGYCAMLAQLIACNRLHRTEQRCARWLLMTQDRIREPVFPMTQERLSVMLGAQRPSVTATMTALREDGCVENSRGQVHIVDRKRLESHACECYALCAAFFDL